MMQLMTWRDHAGDADVEMRLPPTTVAEDPDPVSTPKELYDAGARKVRLTSPIEVDDRGDNAAAARWLLFIRDATALSLPVEWDLIWRSHAGALRKLTHLFPPQSIGGIAIDPSILPSWTKQHHLGKLASFYGPGFVEIRDRRVLPVNRFIIDDQDYLAAVYGLDRSLDANGCPARILADLVDNDLVLIFGENAIWLPYRIVRWPIPSVILLEDGAPTLSSADE